MSGLKRWLPLLVLLVGGTVQAQERDDFLQHQYHSQCLAFADDPDAFRQRLAAGRLPKVPGALVRQLLMGQSRAEGWALAYQGRREYLLILAMDEERCAIVARYADADKTRAWFERLVALPPEGFVVDALAPTPGDDRYGGDARIRRWAWQGTDRVLVHGLMVMARADAQIQAILSLTLTTKTE